MKSIILISILFVIVSSAKLPSSYYGQKNLPHSNLVRILRNDFHSDGVGNYEFAYETENGIAHNEEGHVQNDDDKVVRGSYSYPGDDGKIYTVTYYADANGFHASGDHLPGAHSSTFNKPIVSNYRVKPQPVQKYSPQKKQHQSTATSSRFSGYPYNKPSQAYLPAAFGG